MVRKKKSNVEDVPNKQDYQNLLADYNALRFRFATLDKQNREIENHLNRNHRELEAANRTIAALNHSIILLSQQVTELQNKLPYVEGDFLTNAR